MVELNPETRFNVNPELVATCADLNARLRGRDMTIAWLETENERLRNANNENVQVLQYERSENDRLAVKCDALHQANEELRGDVDALDDEVDELEAQIEHAYDEGVRAFSGVIATNPLEAQKITLRVLVEDVFGVAIPEQN
jgi:predicted nuclease with TOPRIM domain